MVIRMPATSFLHPRIVVPHLMRDRPNMSLLNIMLHPLPNLLCFIFFIHYHTLYQSHFFPYPLKGHKTKEILTKRQLLQTPTPRLREQEENKDNLESEEDNIHEVIPPPAVGDPDRVDEGVEEPGGAAEGLEDLFTREEGREGESGEEGKRRKGLKDGKKEEEREKSSPETLKRISYLGRQHVRLDLTREGEDSLAFRIVAGESWRSRAGRRRGSLFTKWGVGVSFVFVVFIMKTGTMKATKAREEAAEAEGGGNGVIQGRGQVREGG
ncbi:hypothetical protein NMY22_g20265 [Coprinellus aureogranulatus]|nr:hypothetical protein NMY22_g20265 [Coprinellus aureogranulatus]